MKPIQAYQSEDGRLWQFPGQALAAERALAYEKAVSTFADEAALTTAENVLLKQWLVTPEGRQQVMRLADALLALITAEAHARHETTSST
jgi:hypothetical protein